MTRPIRLAMLGGAAGLARRLPSPTDAEDRAVLAALAGPARNDLSPGVGYRQFVKRASQPGVRRAGAAAIVEIDGPLMADPYWIYDSLECLTHSGVAAVLDTLAADPTVATVVLELQCPGWGSDGSTDTLEAIARVRSAKRTIALVHDMAASGGAWMACACEEIVATPTAWMGSIGTIVMGYDDSAAFAKAGVKPVVIASDEDKAVGYPGVPWTDSAIESYQRVVDLHTEDFMKFVAAARRIPVDAVRGLKARMLDARDALQIGLIDRIQPLDAFIARVASLPPRAAASPAPAPPAPPSSPPAQPEPAQPASAVPGATSPEPAPTPGHKETAMDLKSLTLADLRAQRSDLVGEIEAAAREAGIADERARADQPATFAQLKERFGDDPSFVMECQEKGLSVVAATAAHAARLKADLAAAKSELAALQKKGVKEGAEPVSTPPKGDGPVGPAAKHPFLAKCEAYAQEHRVALHAAVIAMARIDPAAHRDYIAAGQTAAQQRKPGR